MNLRTSKILTFLLCAFHSIFFVMPSADCSPSPTPSKVGKLNEIQISLFGQPCFLKGPVEKSTLLAIHAISPEQIPPGLNTEQLKKSLEKLKKNPSLPPSLDLYREKMQERLEAQVTFFDAIEVSKKTGKTDPLLLIFNKYLKNKNNLKKFEALLKKNEGKIGASNWSAAFLDELTDLFNISIQPDPEEDFHRAIHKMNIHYNCSFEEGEVGDSGKVVEDFLTHPKKK